MDNDPKGGVELEQESLGEHVGGVRWTICALLFAATTLNYMDRMVLGLLKPTIQQNIHMTEVGYGYVVVACWSWAVSLTGWARASATSRS